jgi:hypothetical protein
VDNLRDFLKMPEGPKYKPTEEDWLDKYGCWLLLGGCLWIATLITAFSILIIYIGYKVTITYVTC